MTLIKKRKTFAKVLVSGVLTSLVLTGCGKSPVKPQVSQRFWSEHVVGTSWNTYESISDYPSLKFEQDRVLQFRPLQPVPYLLGWQIQEVKEISEDRDSLAIAVKGWLNKRHIVGDFRYPDYKAISEGEGKFFRVEIALNPEVLYPNEAKAKLRDHFKDSGYFDFEGLFTGWGILKLWVSSGQTKLLIYNKKITVTGFEHTPRYISFSRSRHGFPDPRGKAQDIQVPEYWLKSMVETPLWYQGGTGLASGSMLFFEKSRVLEINLDSGVMLQWDILQVQEVSEDRDSVAAYVRDWKTLKWSYGAEFAKSISQGKGNFFEVKVDLIPKILYPEDLVSLEEINGCFFARQAHSIFRVWVWIFRKYGGIRGQMLFYKGIEHTYFRR